MAKPATFQSNIISNQDNPWLISVAESPDNTRTFFIYVKTPTHNRVLVRERSEIVALDSTLKAMHPALSLPPLPVDPSTLSSSDSDSDDLKPKHSIRDLFSILFQFSPPEPGAGLGENDYFSNSTPSLNGFVSTPGSDSESSQGTASESVSAASYFTVISNDADIRASNAWKDFMDVRMDDLESSRLTAVGQAGPRVPKAVNGTGNTVKQTNSGSSSELSLDRLKV